MTKSESVLAALVQLLEGTVDASSLSSLLEKSQEAAYVSEHQTDGRERANEAVMLVVNELKRQTSANKVIGPAILRISTSVRTPLLVHELVTISTELEPVINSNLRDYQFFQDDTNPVDGQLALSMVYWIHNKS